MKEVLKTAVSIFLKLIIVNFMCGIIVISITLIAGGLFSKSVGYTAFGTKEGSEKSETLYSYYYADGEDALRSEYEAKGYTITESPIRELSSTRNTVTMLVAQFFCLMLLCSFVYPKLWHLGTSDSNLVHFKHKKEDKLKGLKVGVVTVIPAVLLLLILFIFKNGFSAEFPIAIYKLLNSSLYGFVELASGSAVTFGKLSVLNFVLMLSSQLVIPIITYISYILGYKNISVGEKIIYKKDNKKG